jgi:hypothetical protein
MPGKYRAFVFADRNEQNENILVPSSVLLLEESSSDLIGLTKDFANLVQLEDEYERWNSSTVFARIGEPLAPYVISANMDWDNVQFAQALKIEDYETARDFRMEWLSWLLLLDSHFPSEETLDQIKESSQELGLSISDVLKARGQFNHELFEE